MAKKPAERLSGNGFLGGLGSNPAIQRLSGEARNLFTAQTDRVVGKVGDSISGASERLTKLGESGELPAIGEGAKRLLQGDGTTKSMLGAAKTSLGTKAGKLVERVKGGLGGGKGKGTGKSKSMNIEESIDIGVPVSTAYNQWTQFKDFSRFMKGVESVEQTSETETTWRAKVFKSRRSWKGKIQEQVPDKRIVWSSEGPKGSTKGVVTFHPLAEDLTRVLVALEYFPSGFMEKTGNLWRAVGRRTRLDLKNFRRFVMMEGEETGAWRGEVRDGEVVSQSDEERPRRRRSAGSSREDGDRPPPRKRAQASRSNGRENGDSSAPRKRAQASRSNGRESAKGAAPRKRTAAAGQTKAQGTRARAGSGSKATGRSGNAATKATRSRSR